MAVTVEKFKRIDILVNNAGMAKYGSINDQSLDLFDLTFRVNLRSVVKLTKLCLPYLRESKEGSIVNVSALSSQRSVPDLGFYSMSKASKN